VYFNHYSPEQAVNTAHQLSPIGVLYTLFTTLYLFMLFNKNKMPHIVKIILASLGKHSYLVYLVHPLIMYYLFDYLTVYNIVMSAPIVIGFYLLTITISLTFAICMQKINNFLPIIGLLLTGSKLPKPKSGV